MALKETGGRSESQREDLYARAREGPERVLRVSGRLAGEAVSPSGGREGGESPLQEDSNAIDQY